MKLLMPLIFSLTSVFCQAQFGEFKSVYGEMTDRSVSLTPFYKPFGNHFDPAVTFGGEFHYGNNTRFTIFQQLEANLYAHALTGTGVGLASSLGIRMTLPAALFADLSVGISGTVYTSGRESFILNEQGNYERKIPLRLLLGLPIDLGLGYSWKNLAIYVKYQYQIEGRYTDILPIIPGSLIGFGVRRTL